MIETREKVLLESFNKEPQTGLNMFNYDMPGGVNEREVKLSGLLYNRHKHY